GVISRARWRIGCLDRNRNQPQRGVTGGGRVRPTPVRTRPPPPLKNHHPEKNPPTPRIVERSLAVTFGVDGLVSGLDTTTLIKQLIKADSIPQIILKNKVSTIKSFTSALQDLNS